MQLYPIDDINAIKDALVASRRTIAVAESVTAGMLQNAFSQAQDARLFFHGGMTVYNVAQKCRQLHVEPIAAQQDNGVSEAISKQLALQVTRAFCSHLGVAIVGYAAPVPEKQVFKPFAYYAIYEGDIELGSGRLEGITGDAMDNQLHYVGEVLAVLRGLA